MQKTIFEINKSGGDSSHSPRSSYASSVFWLVNLTALHEIQKLDFIFPANTGRESDVTVTLFSSGHKFECQVSAVFSF